MIGLKEELIGKVTRNPERVRHGHEVLTGEERRRRLTGTVCILKQCVSITHRDSSFFFFFIRMSQTPSMWTRAMNLTMMDRVNKPLSLNRGSATPRALRQAYLPNRLWAQAQTLLRKAHPTQIWKVNERERDAWRQCSKLEGPVNYAKTLAM